MQIQLREKEIRLGQFGIEIEFYNVDHAMLAQSLRNAGIDCQREGYNHDTRANWKIVHDGSVRGGNAGELVSPILRGINGIVQIDMVCDVLNRLNAKVNKSCGLHVHHDASDFTSKKLVKVGKVYRRLEKHIDSFMPISRRGNNGSYCQSMVGVDLEQNASQLGGRYYKVNFQSYYRHGTIEFRHHSGTVDAQKIINWVLFTNLIMEAAKGRVVSEKPLKRWVDVKWHLGVTTDRISQEMKDMVEFYTNRRAALAAQV